MDRKQLVVQRTREVFGNRLEDVLHMVRQDRQDLRGWEEPAHVRAVLRRQLGEGSNSGGYSTQSTMTESLPEGDFSRCAGEPDRGQQREVLGQILEAGTCGLEKISRSAGQDLSPEERLGVECCLLMYGRPSIQVENGTMARVPLFWSRLEDQRTDVELAQLGVGRIELFGHPEFAWAGTGFLCNETTLLTTRRIAELFSECQHGSWQFRPGITCWMDYRPECEIGPSAGYRVRNILGVHEHYDLAVLEVEPPMQNQGCCPVPLALAGQAPGHLEGRPVYMVGYPCHDGRRNEPETISRIFRDVYNVKRVQPGCLRNCFQFREISLLQHDCGYLGCSAGSCIIDLETHQVIGMHVTGKYLENSTAIPLWMLRDNPLLRKVGVTFAEATTQDLQTCASQLERLARSRFWPEVRQTISGLYQRAFGNGSMGRA